MITSDQLSCTVVRVAMKVLDGPAHDDCSQHMLMACQSHQGKACHKHVRWVVPHLVAAALLCPEVELGAHGFQVLLQILNTPSQRVCALQHIRTAVLYCVKVLASTAHGTTPDKNSTPRLPLP